MPVRFVTITAILLCLAQHAAYAVSPPPACNNTPDDFSQTLSCYQQQVAREALQYKALQHPLAQEVPSVMTVRHYQMGSQAWSPGGLVTPVLWQHDVDIYIPNQPLPGRALLLVNNGTNHNSYAGPAILPSDITPETLTAIAQQTNTIVISISYTPNQYLVFQNDDTPRREDASVARSWDLFMQDPRNRAELPLHIPMAVAISRAITLAEKELQPWHIEKFIVSGLSKRAWATWLAALTDPRIEAIVPFAFDLLNTRQGLKHIYRSYGQNWPITLAPYIQEDIDQQIDTPAFDKLMQIEDPLRYPEVPYRARLSIPKYIINNSGDDFYVPDNSRFYYAELPGSNVMRMVPNSNHYGIKRVVQQSLVSLLNRLQSAAPLPRLESSLNNEQHSQQLTVRFFEEPQQVVMWTAVNPDARDFRYSCDIRYQSTPVSFNAGKLLQIALNNPDKGWQATFIEVTFKDGFVATTPVYISPDDLYPKVAPPTKGPACQTIPRSAP